MVELGRIVTQGWLPFAGAPAELPQPHKLELPQQGVELVVEVRPEHLDQNDLDPDSLCCEISVDGHPVLQGVFLQMVTKDGSPVASWLRGRKLVLAVVNEGPKY